MKLHKKDNLTDAVEALQTQGGASSTPEVADGQVVNNEGEVITLGQNRENRATPTHKPDSLELSDKDLSEIKKIVAAAVENSLDKFLKKFGQNREK